MTTNARTYRRIKITKPGVDGAVAIYYTAADVSRGATLVVTLGGISPMRSTIALAEVDAWLDKAKENGLPVEASDVPNCDLCPEPAENYSPYVALCHKHMTGRINAETAPSVEFPTDA